MIFGAEFAFFAEGNPYENLDVEEAKSKMPWFYAEDHQIKWNIDHVRVLLNPEREAYYQINLNYFIRKKDLMIMISFFFWAIGKVRHTVFFVK